MRPALVVGLMAILTFGDVTPLQGFYAWAQQLGRPPAVPCPQGDVFEILASRFTRGIYAEAGDTIRYSAFLASGDAVINFGGQWANDAGLYKRYNWTLPVSAAASPARATAPASAGWYRDAAVSLQSGTITGQTLYVTQELGRTNGGVFAPIAMLAQGWLTSTAPVSDKPNPPPDVGGSGGGGGGCCLETNYSDAYDPAIDGTPHTIAVPSGQVGRIMSLTMQLSTGGTAGNRRVGVEIAQQYISGFIYTFPIDQPASTNHNYVLTLGAQTYTDTPTLTHWTALPDLWFSEDILLYVSSSNPGAGDSFGNIYIGYQLKGP